ncbi:MAG: hypothetical protein H0V53_02080 [Rubrobacter sp.]|nr:hypothetical protein [Rubrobacter sp.]
MFRLYTAIALTLEVIALAAVFPFVTGMQFLLIAAVLPLTLIAAFLIHRWLGSTAHQVRKLSPAAITGYQAAEDEEATQTTGELADSIVERANGIRRLLSESPSEVQVEMCALGYRACVNDMITLTHLANEVLPEANLLGRLKLRRDRRRATDALSKARQALPPGALRATRQEHS